METDATKIEWLPTPVGTKELEHFLGPTVSPLRKRERMAVTDDECEQAFSMLKHQLITAPILSLPDFNHDFTLDIDASENGIGAVLSQKVGDHERVIAYGSRALTKAKRKYCVTTSELLALVWGVRHFRPYLYGRRLIARTNHSSLKWLHNFRHAEG